ncbi:salicylate hydroxylase [Gemmobacter megaterium]|uniref:Salicylate hydroxylase n=1 Tax=Gemmobacter megaterium TaxID=1086013 RepID=A0A1N7KJL6_9RHOB|nr:FAD-dependent monooxygenase [Gemmobacter megaterium]GGE02546.1 monooxygenase [Gemmobacter megaterium]SIS61811.1 salicylate hydroxylase [Gemmobacter megaterium]
MLIGQEITVLGAGIAGLAVARALALRGAKVTVLEQAEAVREVGAGLQITPNGAAVLAALGLGGALAAAGLASEAVELRDGLYGDLIARLDLAQLRPGQVWHFLHRADLIAVLLQAARDAGVELRLLQRAERVALTEAGPVLVTAQGAELRPGLLIGADGLHSVVRSALNGAADPLFTRQVAWRAVIPAEADCAPVAEVHMGPGRHLVSYPLRDGRLRNIVAVEERSTWVEEGWALKDDAMELRLAFESFAPRVQGWLEQVDECWLWGLFRHPVAKRWGWVAPEATTRGVALLGDAAHPTLPFLAQGANMALEDAWVLASSLANHTSLAAALAGYQSARAGRTARIVAAATANARNYHLRSPMREVAHLGLRTISRLAPGQLLRRYDWIHGMNVAAG